MFEYNGKNVGAQFEKEKKIDLFSPKFSINYSFCFEQYATGRVAHSRQTQISDAMKHSIHKLNLK